MAALDEPELHGGTPTTRRGDRVRRRRTARAEARAPRRRVRRRAAARPYAARARGWHIGRRQMVAVQVFLRIVDDSNPPRIKRRVESGVPLGPQHPAAVDRGLESIGCGHAPHCTAGIVLVDERLEINERVLEPGALRRIGLARVGPINAGSGRTVPSRRRFASSIQRGLR